MGFVGQEKYMCLLTLHKGIFFGSNIILIQVETETDTIKDKQAQKIQHRSCLAKIISLTHLIENT